MHMHHSFPLLFPCLSVTYHSSFSFGHFFEEKDKGGIKKKGKKEKTKKIRGRKEDGVEEWKWQQKNMTATHANLTNS